MFSALNLHFNIYHVERIALVNCHPSIKRQELHLPDYLEVCCVSVLPTLVAWFPPV